MAGFGTNAAGAGNMADDARSDAQSIASAARSGVNAAKRTVNSAVKDTKAVKKAAGQIASGNYLGAAKTALENPMTVIKIVLVALFILSIPLMIVMFCAVFVLELPGSIEESVQAAVTESVDSITLGWEEFKAELSNGIDDFFSILTTGKPSDYSQAYRDDVAAAQDVNFYGYTGTSNTMVAVLNKYFRKAYTDYNDQALEKANKEVEKLKQKALDEGISEEHIYTSVDPEMYEERNYMNWTFYIMAGESYSSRNKEGLHFHVKDMVAAAKDLEKSKIWKVKTKSSYKTEEVVNTWTEEKEVIIEIKNLDGTPKLDAAGNPVTNKKTIKIPHEERYTTATISVSYQYSPSEGARKYILDYFEITDDKKNDSDISDVDIFDTQVAKMAEIYNIKEALFGDNADLDYDPDAPASGMGSGSYGMVISGTLKGLITQFYASHPADTLYDAPAVIGGPWSGWKSTITSSLGVIRGGIAHNGTDIAPGIVQRQLIAPSQGIVIGIQDGFPNGVKQYNGNAQRGNFVFVYYGESSGGGVFVLYQHLTPGITWSVGDTIPAGGVIGRTGWSGLCYSSTGGTGEHLHLEQYIGTTQVNPEAYMSS